ncbi:MAG TPA: GIY-YIG nuclease family protein [Patescibacteria group bacterium]|nr:GIY-YIG nuclease family protein [Patescibacteria group bacterium]
MYYTYVLLCSSVKDGRHEFYTGFSANLPEREIDYKTKSVKTTKKFDKIELVYFEACLNKVDAMKREKQLKTGFGRGYIKRRLESYINTLRA